ncbi:MAG: hypothetical protein WC476_01105 [Phycisphaerae bacterium]
MEKELYWAAGFFDGEGWCGLHKNGGFLYPYIAVAQINKEPLERFQKVFDVGNITGPRIKAKYPNSKPIYQYRVSRIEDTLFVLAKLLPVVCRVKREQILNTVEGMKIGKGSGSNMKREKYCKKGHLLEGENIIWLNDKRGKDGKNRRCRVCTREYDRIQYANKK